MPRIVQADPSLVRPSHRFLFDTNVWMDLYYPDPDRAKQPHVRVVSSVFKAILEQRAHVLFNLTVLSELVNAIIGADLAVLQARTPSRRIRRKDFRESPAYDMTRSRLCGIVRDEILSSVHVVDMPHLDLEALFDEFASVSIDVNDVVLATCAADERCILLSNDADLARVTADVEIWTANPRLLAAARRRR